MNVPVTRDPEQVFHRMMEDARSLAEWLDGKIIDQHGRHMTARGFKQITRQIRDISQDMRKDGLRPGDTVSARLF
jgi:FtsZ-interacting cell division protein ZipA